MTDFPMSPGTVAPSYPPPPARGPAPRRAGAGQFAFPQHIITAVLVTHDGGRWLDNVLRGLFAQRRPVQRVIAVDTGSRDGSLDTLRAALGPDAVLERKRHTGYGAAVAYGLRASSPVSYDEFGHRGDDYAPVEWVWLLHDDSEPAPDALLHLLAAVDDDPEIAVVGPKLRGWYDRAQLLEAGVSIANDGQRWTGLEHNEHDQGQHDDVRPVLAVGSAGMLVRRDVWDLLRGFDTAIPLFRDDVDFCWRANAAGYRVVRAPRAVLYHAEASARERRRIHASVDRPHLLDRRHALYTLLVNRPGRMPLLTYLRLIIWSLLRVAGLLIGKLPGQASDEFLALIAFVTRPDRVLRGRRLRNRMRTVPPEEMADLFPARSAVLRQTLDNVVANLRGDRVTTSNDSSGKHRSIETGPVSEDAEDLDGDGLGWLGRLMRQPTLLIAIGLCLVTLVACRGLLFGGSLMGGALLPVPSGASDLWSKFVGSWHPVGSGSSADSPPYLAVVATLGSILLGKASLAVDLLLLGSVPLSGLTAYYVIRRVVTSPLLRMWGAAAYALLPVATGAIAMGRIGSSTAMILLPLLAASFVSAVGGPGRSGSTRSAWTTAFGLAVATAFAPVTWLIAAIFAVIVLITVAWRTRARLVVMCTRLLIMLAVPLVVLEPWSLGLLERPATFMLEPGMQGANLADPRLSPIHLLFGAPGGPGGYPFWFTIGLLCGGLAGLLRTARRHVARAAWALVLVGFGVGLIAMHARVTSPATGSDVTPWPGVPAATVGFGLVVATLIAAEGARRRIAASSFGWRQPVTVLITALAGLAPVLAAGWWLIEGAAGPLHRGSPNLLPAYVAAEAQTSSHPRTLVLSVGGDGTIDFGLVRSSGITMGDADLAGAEGDAGLRTVVADLLAGVGGDQSDELAVRDVQYIAATRQAAPLVSNTLDAVAGLSRLSTSDGTALWNITDPASRLTIWPTSSTHGATTSSAGVRSLPSGVANARATIPSGPAGRTLVLAENANPHWQARLDGTVLSRTTFDGWAQGFTLPTSGGVVTIGYHDPGRVLAQVLEGLFALVALVMALPTGRRVEETEGEEAAARAVESGERAPADTVPPPIEGPPPAAADPGLEPPRQEPPPDEQPPRQYEPVGYDETRQVDAQPEADDQYAQHRSYGTDHVMPHQQVDGFEQAATGGFDTRDRGQLPPDRGYGTPSEYVSPAPAETRSYADYPSGYGDGATGLGETTSYQYPAPEPGYGYEQPVGGYGEHEYPATYEGSGSYQHQNDQQTYGYDSVPPAPGYEPYSYEATTYQPTQSSYQPQSYEPQPYQANPQYGMTEYDDDGYQPYPSQSSEPSYGYQGGYQHPGHEDQHPWPGDQGEEESR